MIAVVQKNFTLGRSCQKLRFIVATCSIVVFISCGSGLSSGGGGGGGGSSSGSSGTTSSGVVYYVSSTGSDSNVGTSEDLAWNTIAKVNESTFDAGDTISFNGGETFTGTLTLTAAKFNGTSRSPIVINSFGTGRATISSGNDNGLFARNVAGFKVSGLIFTGAVTAANCTDNGLTGAHGIFVENTGTTLEYFHVEDVEISGYCNGILATAKPTAPIDDIDITLAVVHDNLASGIVLDSDAPASNTFGLTNVHIDSSESYDNPGMADSTTGINVTGSGIFINYAKTVTLEYNAVHDNGGDNTCVDDDGATGGGPSSLWVYGDSVTVQYNEVYGQKIATSCPWDGGAINVNGSDALIQYNYTHGNAGVAILQDNAADQSDNIIRYNISENDGTDSSTQGLLRVTGGVTNVYVYNNTLYVNRTAGGRGPLVYLSAANARDSSGVMSNVFFHNNIFYSDDTNPILTGTTTNTTTVKFQDNVYFNPDDDAKVLWNGTTYSSVLNWRNVSSQELLNGTTTAILSDPLLCAPGEGGILTPLTLNTLTAYELHPTSPAINAGYDLHALYDIAAPTSDFFGVSIPVATDFDIGASEWVTGQNCD